MYCSTPIRSAIPPLRIYLQKPATPIEQEYVLEELKHLPICEIN